MRSDSSLTGPRGLCQSTSPRARTTCLIVRERRAVRGGRPPPALDAAPGGGLRVRLRALEPFFAGTRRTRPHGERDRRRTTPRAAAPRGDRHRHRAAGTTRRAARSHRGRAAARRAGHGRDRHRTAGRAVRRTRFHAAQGSDGHPAGGRVSREHGVARGAGVLDRRRGPRLGGSACVRGIRRGSERRVNRGRRP